jgi:hypothetical protein
MNPDELHLSPEQLLQHGDGEPLPNDAQQHLATCAHCREQLAELAAFEAIVAAAVPIADADRLRARAIAEQVMLPRVQPSRRPRLAALAAVLLAAAVALWWSWPHTASVTIVRTATGATRADAEQRFFAELELPAPGFVYLWTSAADGAVQRLLPHEDPVLGWLGATMPLAPGRHRLPASAAFDFAFVPQQPPQSVLIASGPSALTTAALAELDRELGRTPAAERLAVLRRRFPDAWQQVFPPR